MSASYTAGVLISVPDGDEFSFDDGASAFFDFTAYSLSMAALNVVCGVFDQPLDFVPTIGLVGMHLQPSDDGFVPAIVMAHPTAVLAAQRHDVATNTSDFLTQTVYGWSRTLYATLTPGQFVYATLAGYAATGDPRDIIGVMAQDGIVLLDVFHNIDCVRGIPAAALTNPTGVHQGDRDELGNAAVMLLYDGVNHYGFGAPVFEPGDVTYRIPITVPLTKKPVATISMAGMSGTGKYVSLVDIAADHIRYAFYDAGSDTRIQNTSPYSIRAYGTTYQEL